MEMDKGQALDRFLLSVERRALRMASISTGSPDDALDIVQEAMLKLSTSYAGRPESEWGGLFHRVLQNGIVDWHRRRWVRIRWRQLVHGKQDEGEADAVGALPDYREETPDGQLHKEDTMAVLESAIQGLPLRQQQAFMLRLWEGLSVAKAAQAMGCSEGSVKTHYARAVGRLRSELEGYWP